MQGGRNVKAEAAFENDRVDDDRIDRSIDEKTIPYVRSSRNARKEFDTAT